MAFKTRRGAYPGRLGINAISDLSFRAVAVGDLPIDRHLHGIVASALAQLSPRVRSTSAENHLDHRRGQAISYHEAPTRSTRVEK